MTYRSEPAQNMPVQPPEVRRYARSGCFLQRRRHSSAATDPALAGAAIITSETGSRHSGLVGSARGALDLTYAHAASLLSELRTSDDDPL
jgi:hypothetical protein